MDFAGKGLLGDAAGQERARKVEDALDHWGPRDVEDTLAPADQGAHAIVKTMSDVQPVPIRWLWPGRVPLGKLVLFAGNPGLGKSFCTIDVAARVSTGGVWPDGAKVCQPGNVCIMTAEDDLADTVRVRLDRHQADVSRIHVITGVLRPPREDGGEPGIGWVELDQDLRHIERVVEQYDIKLLIVVPVSAYMGNANSHNNAEVRSILGPMSDLASTHGLAIIAITHFNKAANMQAAYRAIGSIAFTAASRMV